MTLVLIIDDSQTDRVLVSGLLQRQAKCEVVFADDGAEGLRLVRELHPDLIITDMQMPVMDGLQLVVHVRNEAIQTPIILMTATGSEDLAVEALRLGASSYVPKRSLPKRLVETARMVLAAANADRQQSLLMGRLVCHTESFHLLSRIEDCRALSQHLQSNVARIWNLDSGARLRIGLVLEEALLNALYHGNLEVSSDLKELPDNQFEELATRRQEEHPYCDRQIEVRVVMSLAEVRFVIRDGGHGFDVANLPDPTDSQNVTRASGRGVMLMHTFMDEVYYNDRGNEVTLIKKRPSMVDRS